MFEPKCRLESWKANDKVTEIITIYLMNCAQSVLLTGITGPYTNQECFEPADSAAIDVSRRCLVSALRELRKYPSSWDRIASVLKTTSPEIYAAYSTEEIRSTFKVMCAQLLCLACFEFDHDETMMLSTIVKYRIAQEEELIGTDSDSFDDEDTSELLQPEEVFNIFNSDAMNDILALSGDANGRYTALKRLYYLRDPRYSDEYWFGLRTVMLEDDND